MMALPTAARTYVGAVIALGAGLLVWRFPYEILDR